jgi:hypothetical protein
VLLLADHICPPQRIPTFLSAAWGPFNASCAFYTSSACCSCFRCFGCRCPRAREHDEGRDGCYRITCLAACSYHYNHFALTTAVRIVTCANFGSLQSVAALRATWSQPPVRRLGVAERFCRAASATVVITLFQYCIQ